MTFPGHFVEHILPDQPGLRDLWIASDTVLYAVGTQGTIRRGPEEDVLGYLVEGPDLEFGGAEPDLKGIAFLANGTHFPHGIQGGKEGNIGSLIHYLDWNG